MLRFLAAKRANKKILPVCQDYKLAQLSNMLEKGKKNIKLLGPQTCRKARQSAGAGV